MTEQSTNPKRAMGVKKASMQAVPNTALLYLGQVMEGGAAKYGPFNWRDSPVDSGTYYDAAQRHLMAWQDGQDVDAESGLPHLAHVMACCAIVLDAESTGNLIDQRREMENGNTADVLDEIAAQKAGGAWGFPDVNGAAWAAAKKAEAAGESVRVRETLGGELSVSVKADFPDVLPSAIVGHQWVEYGDGWYTLRREENIAEGD